MNTRTIIKNALGTLALLASINSQAALEPLNGYTDPVAFQARLDFLGLESRYEGFEPAIGGVDTPWAPTEFTPTPVVDVPLLGVTWKTTGANPGFSIGTLGNYPKEGEYGMFLPDLTVKDASMSYSVETSGFKMFAFGGWFRDALGGGAKPLFTVDDGRQWQDPNGPLVGVDWQFLGFIDEDPNGGFMKVSVTETEFVPTDPELKFFFTDAVTLAVIPVPAALPLFGSALLGLGFIGRRRQKKLS